jgi:hypothetical protein
MISFLVHCVPVSGHWNPAVHAKCYDIDLFVAFGIINTSFNIFTDVLFATFPIPVIWSLQMKKKERLYLIIILNLGYL